MTDHSVFVIDGQSFDFPPNTKREVVERVLTGFACHGRIPSKGEDVKTDDCGVLLDINGQRVRVDDSFLKLSPEQQKATVDEIARGLPGAQGPWTKYQSADAAETGGFIRKNSGGAIQERVAKAIGNYQPYSWPPLIFRTWGPIVFPPVALMLLGVTIGWIIRGFRPH